MAQQDRSVRGDNMKFKKIPTEVDAIQWLPGVSIKGVDYKQKSIESDSGGDIKKDRIIYSSPFVRLDTGVVAFVKEGDWVVTDSEGKMSAYQDAEFKKTFELVK
jgi:hypothetical protein